MPIFRPFLVLFFTLLSASSMAHYPDLDRLIHVSDTESLQRLWSLSKRNLKLDPVSSAYLSKHPVYVSLTTSPKRISMVKHVLKTLDLEHVTEILIALPWRFGRNGQTYEIPEELSNDPKVKILRMEKDLGPISKIIPALQYAQSIDPEAFVISVDDDIAYAPGMINEMIHALSSSRKTVFGGSVPHVTGWGVRSELWPFPQNEGLLVEGWGGNGYRAGEIDTDLLIKLSQLSPSTYNSDDLVIGYGLTLMGLKKEWISKEYYNSDHNRFFSYGFEEDALHSGAGFTHKPENLGDYNPWKYIQSLIDLNQGLTSSGWVSPK